MSANLQAATPTSFSNHTNYVIHVDNTDDMHAYKHLHKHTQLDYLLLVVGLAVLGLISLIARDNLEMVTLACSTNDIHSCWRVCLRWSGLD